MRFRKITIYFLAITFLYIGMGFFNRAQADTHTAIASTNWATGTTWDMGAAPALDDDVVIPNGFTVTIAANVTVFPRNITIDSGGTLTYSGTRTITVNGTFTINGTYTLNTAAVRVYIGAVTVGATGNWDNTGNSQGTFRGGIVLTSGGTFTPGTGLYTFNTNSQAISGTASSISLGGLTTGTSGTTLSVTGIALTVNNNLTVATGTTVDVSTGSLTVTGTTSLTGSIIDGSATNPAANVFTGAVTVNSGGVFNLTTGNPNTNFNGGITMGGTTFTPGTGTVTFTANQSLAGAASAMTFGGAVTVNTGVTLTNNKTGTVTIAGTLTLTGNWTQGASSNLAFSGATPMSGAGTLDATTNANTINFNSTLAQTIPALNYSSLTISGARTTNNVTLASSGTIGVAGTLSYTATYSGGGALVTTGSTLSYNGTGAQSVITFAYNILTINKSSNTATLTGSVTTTGAVNITAGTFSQGASYTLTTGGTTTVGASGIWSNVGTGDLTLGGDIVNSGAITFDGTGVACGGVDNIVITSSSGARDWSGGGSFSLTDTSLTNQTASAAITVYSGTNVSGNTGSWTFSACVFAAIYRSVAMDAASALTTGSGNNLSISGSTATFASALADNIGQGDAIQYDSDNNGSIDAIAFVHARTSSTVYTVKKADGFTPTATSVDDQDWSIFRAYNDALDNAEAGTENSSIDDAVENFDTWVNGKDLVASNQEWNFVLYASGATVDPYGVYIAGWTTGPDNYINIYTPVETTQVGISQRHSGKWGDGYMRSGSIRIEENYVRLDGISIKQAANDVLYFIGSFTGAGDIQISNSFGWYNGPSNSGNHVFDFWGVGTITLELWNNIAINSDTGSFASGFYFNDTSVTAYAYNNTAIVAGGTAFLKEAGTIYIKNSIGYSASGAAFADPYASGFEVSSSASDDGTADDFGGTGNKVDQTFQFVDSANQDYHLSSNDTAALDAGTNLSGDTNLPFSVDIDGQTRRSWDIGADEADVEMIATVMAAGGDYSTLSSWEAGMQTDLTAAGTLAFSGTRTSTIADDATLYLCRSAAYQSVTATNVHVSATQALVESISNTSFVFAANDVWYTNNTCDSSNYFTVSNIGNSAIATAKIDGAWTTADTTAVTVAGWTTGPHNYVRVYTTPAAKHNGKAGTSNYRLNPSSTGSAIAVNENYTQIIGLEILGFGGDGFSDMGISPGASYLTIAHNLIHDEVANNVGAAIYYSGSAYGGFKIYNNVVYNIYNGIMVDNYSGILTFFYNNTVADSLNIGFSDGDNGEVILKNNLAYNNTDNYSGTSYHASSTNNLSGPSQSDAPGSNPQNSKTVQFVDAANDDFHLSPSDTAAKNAGTNLQADSNLPFSQDIDGSYRGNAWDIGADEVATEFVSTVMQSGGNYATLSAWEADVNSDLTASTTRVYSGSLTSTITDGATVTLYRSGVSRGITATLVAKTATQILLTGMSGATPLNVVANDQWRVDGTHYWTVTGTLDSLGASPIAVAKIDGAWTSADTTAVEINGWTTSLDNYIKIYTTTAARHNGKWDDTKYRLTLTNTNTALDIKEEYTRIIGLQINQIINSGSSERVGIDVYVGASAIAIYINDNILKFTTTGGTGVNTSIKTVYNTDSSGSIFIYNNLIYDSNYVAGSKCIEPRTTANTYIYNNTIYNCLTGIDRIGQATVFAKNNIVQNTTTGYTGTFDASSTNNLSDHADAPGLNPINNATVSFVDEANDDFHLAPTDTAAKGAGVNPFFALDNFDRSNESPLGGNWTTGGYSGMYHRIVSNQITGSSSGGSQGYYAYYNAGTFSNAQYAQATIVTKAGALGVSVRGSSAGAYYFMFNGSESFLGISNGDASLFTDIGGDRGSFSDGDTIGLAVDENFNFTLYKNGAVIGTATDSGNYYQTGSPGLSAYFATSTGKLDNWQGGNLGSSLFNTDIDGAARPTVASGLAWDIGADQTAIPIYRSVGPGVNAVLANGATNHLNISGSTATFDTALPDNIGVGDALEYDDDNNGTIDASDSIAFITARTSSTIYTIKTSSGSAPQAPSAADEIHWNVNRAYTSLANAESGTESTVIDADLRNFDTWTDGKDILASNEQWNIAAYANGTTPDSTAFNIDGWTTGAQDYIKVYTPVYTSEVGTTQRHAGKWDDGKYQLYIDNSDVMSIYEENVRIDGLQIGNYNSSGNAQDLIWIANQTVPGEIDISNSILRGHNNASYYQGGIKFDNSTAGMLVRAWNNLAYNFGTSDSNTRVILSNQPSSYFYAYNNTVTGGYAGYNRDSSGGIFVAKNNISQGAGAGSGYYGTFDAASDYNISDLAADAPGSNSKNSTTVSFVDATNKDFHLLSSDTAAKNSGVDLSADANLPFSTDIDGQSRLSAGTGWDIGADEEIRSSVNIKSGVNLKPGATISAGSGSCDNATYFCSNYNVCGNDLGDGAHLIVARADAGTTKQWKTAGTACDTPQCKTNGAQDGDNLVARNDIDFTAYPARDYCKSIGARLPTKSELSCMYTNRTTFGNNFVANYYWSATEYSGAYAWGVAFSGGGANANTKTDTSYVRCVKGW